MLNTHARTTRTALGGLTLGLALVLGACGADDSASSSGDKVSTTEHNDADVNFATDMIQHHAQALTMVDLTAGRTLDPEVQQLAENIRAAQTPEIEEMTDWLTSWGEDIPETTRDHTNAHGDMGSMDGDDMGEEMPGIMSQDDLEELEDASDAEFQDMWLEMMVEHHTGAVQMASTEREDGQYASAVDLAGQIIDSQTKEIDTMNELLS
jgi:uncharacterized protein (DUF305 family)